MLKHVIVIVLLVGCIAAAACAQQAASPPAAQTAPAAKELTSGEIQKQIDVLQEQLSAALTRENQDKTFWTSMSQKALRMMPQTAFGRAMFLIGFVGQFVFFMRFVVQWLASERAKRTVVPIAFWHLSIFGTVMVLIYAFSRSDPVFILAYGLNIFLYVRNLVIARRHPELALVAEKDSE